MIENVPLVKIEKLIELMKLFSSTDSIEKDRLSKALHVHNYAGISSRVKTAMMLGLLDDDDKSINLTPKGEDFTKGHDNQVRCVSNFLIDDRDGLGAVTDCLKNEGPQFSPKEVQKCVQLHVNRETQAKKSAGILISWYQFADMLRKNKDHIDSTLSMLDYQLGEASLFSNESLDFKLYLDLTLAEFDTPSSNSPLSFENIQKTYRLFCNAKPSDSETFMLDFTSKAFRILGFSAIFRRGPRLFGNLDFGSMGDDLFVVLPHTGRISDKSIHGVAFACELKRSIGNKKAVGQAELFMNQVKAEFPKLQVFPIVITGAECYHDRTARTYASSSHVMHIPLEFLFEMFKLQLKKYRNQEKLVTALDFISLYSQLRSVQEIEPRTPDLLEMIK
ncbi:MAG: hypothetical protein ACTSV3_04635 [Candidatus Thorarchaeota archaeon]|nr:MAG: hypothetical protein DRP09_01510 [Candidatus Thorarchaeota archaeon]